MASAPSPGSGQLLGRGSEIERLHELTGAARSGRGGALVLRGEAGIGKSALLDHVVRAAAGFRTARACGSQYERELPFAALHQLCVPALPHLGELPARHRESLQTTFGLVPGAPDVFRIGLATLDLLSCAARESPLLCLIDDAQWLDTASSKVLAFLARRIACEPVAMVFAVRPEAAEGELDELPALLVSGLSDADSRALLAAKSHVSLDEQVCQRLVAEARGNPLALLELPRAGGFAPPDTSSVSIRIERGFQARVAELPEEARLLLIVASADPTGDPGLLWSAARHLGLDLSVAGAAATATALVDFSTRVRFCHPLARSAVYRAAQASERRTAHRVLAEVTDAVTDPDRRAWHRARASAGPDEDVAAELERSALRARTRGGVAAAAAFLESAAALSLHTGRRIRRTLAAVRAKLDAGFTESAAELLTTVENAGLDELQSATVDLLRGHIAFARHHDDNGPAHTLRAARRLAEPDPEWSRHCLLDALEMSLVVGRAGGMMDLVLAEARSVAQPAHSPDVLDALIRLTTEGHRAAAPSLREALDGNGTPMWTRRPGIAVMLAAELWDPRTHTEIIQWLMKTGRESGSPLVLRLGLAQTATQAVMFGDIGGAMAAIAEEEAITDATGGLPVAYHRLHLAALRGRRQEALDLFESVTSEGSARGAGQLIADAHWSAAVLHNGLGDYPAALSAARKASAHGDLFLAGISLPELVEAAVRCGERDAAVTALASLTERTEAGGTDSGLGIAAYARGLVTGVEDHYREAVERLEKSPMVPYRARAHLLYGEWLRREGRRRDGRQHLETAHALLWGAGMEAFARRAAGESRATGGKARGRSRAVRVGLTEQEMYVARLVATGATSKEVAGRLFLSPRTVDAHLRAVFRKLDISSRKQLRDHPDLLT
ncbi:AAA family ATPase [Streptomyces sp. AM 3-1-1]|uniref:AAA family ATPase n=1 Tax=Streptomyces sp. AM 3-1-1 TaxID=3028711 RepID=UPI0023B9148D|nr:AAA family ATPase [Streptomyces sp. AM 3-1-1]WEH30914.1 AAA family ATPase [Streptomyces sp. AM 3-1-1]